MTNYALNGGTATTGNGPFSWSPRLSFIGYQHITDGLSTTALASEWLTGVPYRIRDPKRSVFQTDVPHIKASDFGLFLEECRSLDPWTGTVNGITKGHPWAKPGFGLTLYNHALLPDENSCTNGTLTLQGAWSAASGHNGGVNVAFADAHVSYMKKSLSRPFWSALGTMNGQEVTDSF